MNALNLQDSELHIDRQLHEFADRFPVTDKKTIRKQLNNTADIISGIDAKIDTKDGSTYNLQAKHRSKADADYQLPVKKVMVKSLKNADTPCINNEYVLPNVKEADYFIFIRANNPSMILSADSLNSIFHRYKSLQTEEIEIRNNSELSKNPRPIDISDATMFINPNLLAKLAITDYLIATFGTDFVQGIKSGNINIADYLM